MSLPDVQAAFRAGVEGRSLREPPPDALAEAAAVWRAGPNQSLLAALARMPGLTDPRAAFAAGRATQRIMQLFDEAGAPASVGQQFLDNLRSAVTTQRMRDRHAIWGGADTVAMFMEMYARIFGEDGADFGRIESALLAHALSDPEHGAGRGTALVAALRRWRG